MSNNKYDGYLKISDTSKDYLFEVYNYFLSCDIWSTGEIYLVFELKSESRATNTELTGSEAQQTIELQKVKFFIFILRR